MPSPTEYQQRIAQLDWQDLTELWEGIKRGWTPGWEPGKAFEYLVLRAFELDGAIVRWPFVVWLEDEPVEQVDGAIHADGLYCLLETKDSIRPISVGPLAKLRGQLARRPAGAVGLLFSRSGFTGPAASLARFVAPQTILLWKGSDVESLLESRQMRRALRVKYRGCIEEANPNYDFRREPGS